LRLQLHSDLVSSTTTADLVTRLDGLLGILRLVRITGLAMPNYIVTID
jgi:hypothetical protein